VLHGPTTAWTKAGISRLIAAEIRFLISTEGKTRGKRIKNVIEFIHLKIN
jgi:hypothetical protein